ncbi:MAG: tryptophan--tRNA ligase [Candidatus Cloacimonetes bacterium]|nr:tryptophan--tRNA ligase [Candidatus Cloacimonadota bacterium]
MKTALTGIKPTGVPHIGNYMGAIRPALELTRDYRCFYFIADYHALNFIRDPKELKQNCYEVAATWLACGLDPAQSAIYRQSQVPETFELSTILMCFTAKGLMNRAHAYKAMLQTNRELGRVPDDGVNMGLFTYPVLMAADIMLFCADVVPVGRDQAQHIEMAQDIAQAFNYVYGCELLKVPQPLIREQTQTVTGLDGRKMSKSYGNTILLFLPPKQLRKQVMRIVTNSQVVEEPKDPDTCNVFAIYKLFATEDERNALAERYRAGGMGWGDAKQTLFEKMNDVLTPYRERYDAFMADKPAIDRILADGAEQVRPQAASLLAKLRKAVGIV